MIGIGYMLLSAVLYGLMPTLGVLIFTEITPLSLAFFRNLFAVLVFLIILILRKQFHIITSMKRRDFLILALIGIFIFSGFQLFFLIGIEMTTASVGALISNTNKIFFIIFGFIFIKSPLTKKKGVGILLAMLGVFFIIWNGGFTGLTTSATFFVGCVLLLVCAACCGLFYTVNEKYVGDYNSNPILFIVFLFSLVLITPVVLPDISLIFTASSTTITLVIFLGVACTGLPALFFSESLKYLDRFTASSFSLTTPLFAVLFAILILGEVLTLYIILGALLILVGNFLTIGEKKQRIFID